MNSKGTEYDHSSSLEELDAQLSSVSTQPGVYLMKDAGGHILYVGKARNLKKRLQSYFQKGRPHDPKTTVMIGKVAGFETILTHTEKEALILESNLIKRHRPRYNVVLKDDKRYPSLRLDVTQPFPQLTIARKIQHDGALYFGPYASADAVRQTLKFINKTFKLRKCGNRIFRNRTRPCLNHQMGLCLGPCCEDIDPAAYAEIVKEVVAFLKGRTPELIQQVRQQMQAAAQQEAFETAAALRDKLFALQKTLEKQVTVTTDFKDRDIFAMLARDGLLVATLLRVRGGFLQGSRHFQFDQVVGPLPDQLAVLLRQYYEGPQNIPGEIMVSEVPTDKELVEDFLSDKKGSRVKILTPQRGEKHRLVEMALQNAEKKLEECLSTGDIQQAMLQRLQARMHLTHLPMRIECFDNSNLQGSEPVSAMVVFEGAQPQPKAYRRYKIKNSGRPDDYAAMAEVIRRRFGKGEASKPYPDLLLVDGGRGQIGVTMAILQDLGLQSAFDVAGIAKHDPLKGEQQDKIYVAGRANEVQFDRQTDLLLFLQRIRDEAHRFAITFQRRRRHKRSLHSQLDDIPGIGPARRKLLLRHFGSVARIFAASVEELQALPGIPDTLARAIADVSGHRHEAGNSG